MTEEIDSMEFDATTEQRWRTYKRQCAERGDVPMSWGVWCSAGEPVWETNDDE